MYKSQRETDFVALTGIFVGVRVIPAGAWAGSAGLCGGARVLPVAPHGGQGPLKCCARGSYVAGNRYLCSAKSGARPGLPGQGAGRPLPRPEQNQHPNHP